MDDSTRLRRQFRKRAADPMACLLFKDGLYHYSRRVPAAVRAADPSLPEAIRRSTGTERLKEAQAVAREWAAEDEQKWLDVVSGKAPSVWVQALRDDRDVGLERVREFVESRAEALGVVDGLERARTPKEVPKALKTDPKAREALRAVYAERGAYLTWVDAWEAVESRSGLEISSRRAYRSAMRQLDKANVSGPHEVTREDAKAFLKELAQRLTASSANVYIAAATLVLVDLAGDDEERTRIFHGHRLRYVNKPTQRAELTRDDLRALIATDKMKRPLSLFLRILLGTGARREEAHAGEYDLERRVLIIRKAKSDAGVRDIPLSSHVLPTARAWVALKAAKKLPHVDTLAENFVAIRALAELSTNKTLHSCRHSFLTELARQGVPEDRRKAIGGHSKGGNVHAGYVHLGPEDLRADVEKVDFESGIEWP
jgi:hypothetical protein